MKPILYIFSGLPGVGKTSISKEFAKEMKAVYFRLDTIEHGIRELCSFNVQGEGYGLTYRIVADNLRIGNSVVVDCCNPWALTRKEWENVATREQCAFCNIEIVCTDKKEHRKRVEELISDIDGFAHPSWQEVMSRDYQEWTTERIVIDSSLKYIESCVRELRTHIQKIYPAPASS